MKLENLVGIPWNGIDLPPFGADCVSLAVYAQKVLWGREVDLDMSLDWNEGDLRERSQEIRRHVSRFAYPVKTPEAGDVGVMATCGYCHLITFVDDDLVLHTVQGGSSRLSRYTSGFQRRMESIWRIGR